MVLRVVHLGVPGQAVKMRDLDEGQAGIAVVHDDLHHVVKLGAFLDDLELFLGLLMFWRILILLEVILIVVLSDHLHVRLVMATLQAIHISHCLGKSSLLWGTIEICIRFDEGVNSWPMSW